MQYKFKLLSLFQFQPGSNLFLHQKCFTSHNKSHVDGTSLWVIFDSNGFYRVKYCLKGVQNVRPMSLCPSVQVQEQVQVQCVLHTV